MEFKKVLILSVLFMLSGLFGIFIGGIEKDSTQTKQKVKKVVVQQTVSNVDTEKFKQELLAEYEKKLDSITKINEVKTVEIDIPVQGSKEEFIRCIKKCTRENTVESLVDFCIKDKCK